MSRVYRAVDNTLDREVAVKVLHPHLAEKPEARRRFSREARAIARLRHPNIVEIYDYAGAGRDDGAPDTSPYIVTEFIRGETLRKLAERVRFDPPELAAMAGHELARALAHAHAAGVVHRDLKPENVMVRSDGVVKLMDFGIATLVDRDEKMTATGALLGSPAHMAPETIEGKEADAQSDLFSLGTIVYWLATGQLPFEGPNAGALLKRILDGHYLAPQLANPAVPDWLATTIASLLEREPAKRAASAQAVAESLAANLADAGVTEPGKELAAFWAAPETRGPELRARLVERYAARGDEELAAGRTMRALAAFNRVLALEPGNAAVREKLARLRGRAKLRQRAKVLGALALGVAAIAGVLALVPRPLAPAAPTAALPPRAPPPAPVIEAPRPVAMPAGAVEQPAPKLAVVDPTKAPAVHARPRPARKDEPHVAAAPPPEVPFELRARNYAHFWIDGVDKGQTPQVSGRLPAGPHLVRAEHFCCETWEQTITLDAARPEKNDIRVELLPKPARLEVLTSEPGALVYVDGVGAGTADASQIAPIKVPMIVQGKSFLEREITVRVEKDGRSAQQVARVQAANASVVRLPLRAE